MGFLDVTQSLLKGFGLNCLIFFVTLLLALPLGLLISFCTMSKFKPLKAVTKVFVWIIRGVPLMLQIIIIVALPYFIFGNNFFYSIDKYFILNFGIQFGKDGASIGTFIGIAIAFTINYACYFSEIYRGGIESISKGQYEAGKVLGMTKNQIFSKVVLMQVVKRIVPPMSNEIITLIKDTALSNIVSVIEIIKVSQDFTQKALWPLFYSSVFFLVFVGLLTIIFGKIEKKLSYYKV